MNNSDCQILPLKNFINDPTLSISIKSSQRLYSNSIHLILNTEKLSLNDE